MRAFIFYGPNPSICLLIPKEKKVSREDSCNSISKENENWLASNDYCVMIWLLNSMEKKVGANFTFLKNADSRKGNIS